MKKRENLYLVISIFYFSLILNVVKPYIFHMFRSFGGKNILIRLFLNFFFPKEAWIENVSMQIIRTTGRAHYTERGVYKQNSCVG